MEIENHRLDGTAQVTGPSPCTPAGVLLLNYPSPVLIQPPPENLR